ncbi:MAG: trehalose-phosphatase [Ktedonobacteraceae bacterium]
MSFLQEVLSQRPTGLVFDIDGTLSPIAPTPDKAKLYPGVAGLLKQAQKYTHVAILTGRAIESGAAMVNVDGATYIGSHGLEWSSGLPASHAVEILPEALGYIEPGKCLLDLAEQQLTGIPGLLVERKRIGGAIHYRLCSNPEQVRHTIFTLLGEPARQVNMRLSEGKKVVEIRPPLAVDKGQSLRRLVQQLGLHSVVFAGDDRTDLDAVLEIARLKQEGVLALSIVVQHTDTLPALLENADMIVQEVEGMVDLLRQIVERLENL